MGKSVMIFIKGYILAALASVPVYGMSLSEHNAFHTILTEMQDEVWQEHEATTNQQAISIMDLILQDLDKIDQFHHNYEMMTHGETSRPGFYTGYFSLHEQLGPNFTMSTFQVFHKND